MQPVISSAFTQQKNERASNSCCFVIVFLKMEEPQTAVLLSLHGAQQCGIMIADTLCLLDDLQGRRSLVVTN